MRQGTRWHKNNPGEVCNGHKIIDEKTGQPPSITERT